MRYNIFFIIKTNKIFYIFRNWKLRIFCVPIFFFLYYYDSPDFYFFFLISFIDVCLERGFWEAMGDFFGG